MFHREEVECILEQARRMDLKLEINGVSEHQYKLNPPVDLKFVHAIEKKYHFQFPEDYVQFITEVGDGGAGPGYGLFSFKFYNAEAKSARDVKLRDVYLHGLSRDPHLLPLEPDFLDDFCVAKDEYQQNPEKYLRATGYNKDTYVPYGFFHLGTYGCGRDYGVITFGERRGQIVIHDLEGAFELEADNFQAFYQDWLAFLLDTERFKQELEEGRRIKNR